MINIVFLNGTKSQNETYIGAPNTISIDSETMVIRLHDGITPGGFIIPNLTLINELINQKLDYLEFNSSYSMMIGSKVIIQNRYSNPINLSVGSRILISK